MSVERFRAAQNSSDDGFDAALREIQGGAKQRHWIWYVFPQLSGLGTSSMAQRFAIASEREAREFLRDPELRARLEVITAAVAGQLERGISIRLLMGSEIDARKLVSSLTLFRDVVKHAEAPEERTSLEHVAQLCDRVLDVADGQGYPPCAFTLRRLDEMRSGR